MPAVLRFLKPAKTKVVFLVEWSIFILLTALQGELNTTHQVLVALYPLGMLYLTGCMLSALSQSTRRAAQGWKLLRFALGLILFDQVCKVIVIACVPYQASIPLIPRWLHLTHVHNMYGSWIVSTLDIQPVIAFIVFQWLLVVPFLLISFLCYRYYIVTQRESLWAEAAFLGLFAGLGSWICDMAFRGHITDFINLPDLVSFDLKDVFVTVGIAAIFAEALDNPAHSWRWRGWRQEEMT